MEFVNGKPLKLNFHDFSTAERTDPLFSLHKNISFLFLFQICFLLVWHFKSVIIESGLSRRFVEENVTRCMANWW